MEYRFTLTPRLLGVAVVSLLALLALLFLLGVQIGRMSAAADAPDPAAALPKPFGAGAPVSFEQARKAAASLPAFQAAPPDQPAPQPITAVPAPAVPESPFAKTP